MKYLLAAAPMATRVPTILVLSLVALSINVHDTKAVEGGFGAYLLGSRDLLAGVVPPPGVYLMNDTIFVSGTATFFRETTLNAWVNKTAIRVVPTGKLFGGNISLALQFPFVAADLEVAGRGEIGNTSGLSDITLTPAIGWHAGNFHYLWAAAMLFPTGSYDPINPINNGKNTFAVDTAFAATYLDPQRGHELDVAAGVTLSEENDRTHYKNGPEFHIEATLAQRFGNGWALGVTGHAYHQLADDSGAGAERLRSVLGRGDLIGSVYGLGPLISYQTKLGGVDVALTAKYVKQFEATNHFEADSEWVRLRLGF